MGNKIISIQSLTKDYGNGRGVFDINLDVFKGETVGLVGTNGSGKTTTIRHIMGFLKADSGRVEVCDLDAWEKASEIKRYVEYLPGEIAFPDLKDGTTFIKSQAELLGLDDLTYANDLIKRLRLDTSANLKRMSKGMKQKTAIVSAFMADKEVIVLDEPTTGLDPYMREVFLDIIREEKAKGKTILLSSQTFSELEAICDRVALVLNGKIIDIADINKLKNGETVDIKIEFNKEKEYLEFKKLDYQIIRDQKEYNQVTIKLNKSSLNKLFTQIAKFDLKFIRCMQFSLEKYFKEKIKEVKNDK